MLSHTRVQETLGKVKVPNSKNSFTIGSLHIEKGHFFMKENNRYEFEQLGDVEVIDVEKEVKNPKCNNSYTAFFNFINQYFLIVSKILRSEPIANVQEDELKFNGDNVDVVNATTYEMNKAQLIGGFASNGKTCFLVTEKGPWDEGEALRYGVKFVMFDNKNETNNVFIAHIKFHQEVEF